MTNLNTSATGGFLAPSQLPPEDAALDAILQELVVGVTALPGNLVRPRWQSKAPIQPEPNVDWCAIGVIDEQPEFNISLVHIGGDNPPGPEQGYSISEDNDVLTVLASFYGPTARGNAKLLRTGLMIAQNRETLFTHSIELMEMPGKLTFVPDITNERAVWRADLFLKFRRCTRLIWPILDVLSLDGSIVTDTGPSAQLLTPHSLLPLKE